MREDRGLEEGGRYEVGEGWGIPGWSVQVEVTGWKLGVL